MKRRLDKFEHEAKEAPAAAQSSRADTESTTIEAAAQEVRGEDVAYSHRSFNISKKAIRSIAPILFDRLGSLVVQGAWSLQHVLRQSTGSDDDNDILIHKRSGPKTSPRCGAIRVAHSVATAVHQRWARALVHLRPGHFRIAETL